MLSLCVYQGKSSFWRFDLETAKLFPSGSVIPVFDSYNSVCSYFSFFLACLKIVTNERKVTNNYKIVKAAAREEEVVK